MHIHDGMPHDPIQGQGQGHGGRKLWKWPILKSYLLRLYACNQKTSAVNYVTTRQYLFNNILRHNKISFVLAEAPRAGMYVHVHAARFRLYILEDLQSGRKKYVSHDNLHIISSSTGRFSKFLYCFNLWEICNSAVTNSDYSLILKRVATLPCEIFMAENWRVPCAAQSCWKMNSPESWRRVACSSCKF